MGCDIHLHIEVKVNNKWEHYSHPKLARDYAIFDIMAGVRDESVTPISEPKGLPKDLSLITKIDYGHDEGETHSESWLDRNEIKKLCCRVSELEKERGHWSGQWEHTQLGYANGNPFWSIGSKGSEDSHPKEYQDCRFVFWFDN